MLKLAEHLRSISTTVKEFGRICKSISLPVHILGVGSLFAWAIKAVFLDTREAPYIFVAQLAKVVDGVFSAVLAGYVFYVIFALYPEYRSRKVIAPYLSSKTRNVVGDCMALLHTISQASSQPLPFATVTIEQIRVAFSATKLNIPPPNIDTGADTNQWLHFFIYRQDRSKDAIYKLISLSKYFDSDVTYLLTSIDDCSFFGQTRMAFEAAVLSKKSLTNEDLSIFADGFNRYLGQCRLLAEWHDRQEFPDVVPLMQA